MYATSTSLASAVNLPRASNHSDLKGDLHRLPRRERLCSWENTSSYLEGALAGVGAGVTASAGGVVGSRAPQLRWSIAASPDWHRQDASVCKSAISCQCIAEEATAGANMIHKDYHSSQLIFTATATSSITPETATASLMRHWRRVVAGQAAASAQGPSGSPSTFASSLLPAHLPGDNFGRTDFDQRCHSPSHPQRLTTTTDPGSFKDSHHRSFSSSHYGLNHRRYRRLLSRFQPDLQRHCSPRYCCLHRSAALQPRRDSIDPRSSSVSHPHDLGSPAVPASEALMDGEDPHNIAAQQEAAQNYQAAHDVSLLLEIRRRMVVFRRALRCS